MSGSLFFSTPGNEVLAHALADAVGGDVGDLDVRRFPDGETYLRVGTPCTDRDVAIVIGANDIVNPAALEDPGSPIYGMPILNADKARTVIVSKRSMASGYAGVDNELFGYPNCLMLFGDAKAMMTKVVGELKEM